MCIVYSVFNVKVIVIYSADHAKKEKNQSQPPNLHSPHDICIWRHSWPDALVGLKVEGAFQLAEHYRCCFGSFLFLPDVWFNEPECPV